MSTNSWLKNHRKSVAVHITIFCGFLIFCLFVSEPLFNMYYADANKNPESNLHHISIPDETNNICYNFDRITAESKYIVIIGWAFVGGKQSENDEVLLCLKSKSNTYFFDTFTIPRPDLTENYAYLNLNLDRSGFRAIIPIQEIKDGSYDIGCLIQDDNFKAFQYVEMRMVKSRNSITFPFWTSTLQENILLPAESNSLKYHIDIQEEVTKEGKEYIQIEGWAFTEDNRIKQNQKTYLVLNSGQYTYIFDTKQKYTPWVTVYNKNMNLNLDWVGFRSLIPKDELNYGTYQIGIHINDTLQYTDDANNKHKLNIQNTADEIDLAP